MHNAINAAMKYMYIKIKLRVSALVDIEFMKIVLEKDWLHMAHLCVILAIVLLLSKISLYMSQKFFVLMLDVEEEPESQKMENVLAVGNAQRITARYAR
mmetsp:Transcript_26139/g.25753  ORF Transcript_26139/g.25753 Transcript_26139/m.25753 type:complete len:99 (+) Transcript_26139:68-364(+)